MCTKQDRREFFRTAGACGGGILAAGLPWRALAGEHQIRTGAPSAEALGWRLSAAQYTFRSFTLYETLDKVAALGIQHVEPAFFLRLDTKRPELQVNESLSAADRKGLQMQLDDRGMSMPSFYSNVGDNVDSCRQVFDFAKEMKVKTFIAEPPAEAFDTIEKLCDEYEINLAIHNHPKSPQSRYWRPENVLAVCINRSRRIGVCCDTGHWVRSGLNPVECLKKLEGRIISYHLKDVAEWGKPEARDVPLGTGRADYTAVLREAFRQKFQGLMTIEYEHDSPQLMDEVRQCVAFVEKTAKQLK